MKHNSQFNSFFALLRAGLWEQEIHLQPYEPLDFDALYELADGQAVVGLIGAGLEHITDTKVQRMQARPFLKRVFSLEQRNEAMNSFIADLFDRFEKEDITAVLVKGQGVALCYAQPLWRSSGDIDLLLDRKNYEKAKGILSPLAPSTVSEEIPRLHFAMELDGFTVELHGSMRTDVSKRMSQGVDAVQDGMFAERRFRTWMNNGHPIPLPCPDDDIIFVFTHYLGHFFIGGIGLRQICDWCRLLWTYRDSIDSSLLESRLNTMGLMSEWHVFAAFAVDYLGMPVEAMPFYSPSKRWSHKASLLLPYILETGNFGHNRDTSSHFRYPAIVSRVLRAWAHFKDNVRICRIFPLDVPRFFCYYLLRKTGKVIGVR